MTDYFKILDIAADMVYGQQPGYHTKQTRVDDSADVTIDPKADGSKSFHEWMRLRDAADREKRPRPMLPTCPHPSGTMREKWLEGRAEAAAGYGTRNPLKRMPTKREIRGKWAR